MLPGVCSPLMPSPIRKTLMSLLLIPPLLAFLLLLNLVQMLSLLLRLFSGPAFRFVNRQCAAGWFNFLTWALEHGLGVRFVVTGDALPARENAFVIANHQSGCDIPALVALASRCRRAGDLKWFVKHPIKWVPGIGWGMQFLDCIFVRRNWTADKDKILATFERLRTHRVPFWILSFVEGTRLTPAKLERSRVYCAKAGLPVLANVMSPRTRGFEATLEGLGSLTDAVYDVTIAFEGYEVGRVPGLKALFFGGMNRVHMHVRRYPAAALPASREARVAWVLDRFEEKDRMLARFRDTGSLSA
jgi:1-acyl-sn-glycerol-3-phosphate acyltransferase